MKREVYLGLGGNEGEVRPRLEEALFLLSQEKIGSNWECSSFYQTSPVEMEEVSPLFVNGVCRFLSPASLGEIFEATQRVEKRLGKKEKGKRLSRPIDIDLLFYGNWEGTEGGVEIPHPRWKERLFVLIPLRELTSIVSIGEMLYPIDPLILSLRSHSDQTVSRLR